MVIKKYRLLLIILITGFQSLWCVTDEELKELLKPREFCTIPNRMPKKPQICLLNGELITLHPGVKKCNVEQIIQQYRNHSFSHEAIKDILTVGQTNRAPFFFYRKNKLIASCVLVAGVITTMGLITWFIKKYEDKHYKKKKNNHKENTNKIS